MRKHKPSVYSQRGFTIVELLAVIFIIILLGFLLLPVAMGLLGGGRSLPLIRNSIDGYFNGLRMEAANRNLPMIIALLPPQPNDTLTTYRLKTRNAKGAQIDVEVTPGFYAFYYDLTKPRSASAEERLIYVGRNLVFEDEFAGDVELHPDLFKGKPPAPSQKAWEDIGVFVSSLNTIGIPTDKAYLILVRADGKALIPGDVSGYQMESNSVSRLTSDLVFRDDSRTLFLDVSANLKVRDRMLDDQESQQCQFKPRQ